MNAPLITPLTPHTTVATGRKHAAIYCNDEELENACIAAGKATGDLVHPIPYCPEFYKPEYKSEVLCAVAS
jgi:probable aminopeptidase NPEPL1